MASVVVSPAAGLAVCTNVVVVHACTAEGDEGADSSQLHWSEGEPGLVSQVAPPLAEAIRAAE